MYGILERFYLRNSDYTYEETSVNKVQNKEEISLEQVQTTFTKRRIMCE